jgi:hypothetical protein
MCVCTIAYSIEDTIKTRAPLQISFAWTTYSANQCLIALNQSLIITTNKCLQSYLNSLAGENPSISILEKRKRTDNRREFPYWLVNTPQRWPDFFTTCGLMQTALLFLTRVCRGERWENGDVCLPWENVSHWHIVGQRGDKAKIEANLLLVSLPWEMWSPGSSVELNWWNTIPTFVPGCGYQGLELPLFRQGKSPIMQHHGWATLPVLLFGRLIQASKPQTNAASPPPPPPHPPGISFSGNPGFHGRA